MTTYTLQDLLFKMGTPEVATEGQVQWSYFNMSKKNASGMAHVRLENGGRALIAELTHAIRDYEDDDGNIHALYQEKFHIKAEQVKNTTYRIKEIHLDQAVYLSPTPAIVDLALARFHASAFEISIRMVEYMFEKNNAATKSLDKEKEKMRQISNFNETSYEESDGVVIAFPLHRVSSFQTLRS